MNSSPKLSNKELIAKLKSEIREDICFVIGGGPSKIKCLPDNSVLFNRHVIATNDAYQIFPDAMLCQFADKTWYNWHRDKIHTQYKGPVTTSCRNTNMNEWKKTEVIPFYFGDRKGGISTDIDKISGNNAGHQAINFATHLGFKRIVLIGFDLDPTSPKTHWHNNHRRATNVANYAVTMIPGFKTLVPLQEKLNFKLYNVNRESHLKFFEFADMKDFL